MIGSTATAVPRSWSRISTRSARVGDRHNFNASGADVPSTLSDIGPTAFVRTRRRWLHRAMARSSAEAVVGKKFHSIHYLRLPSGPSVCMMAAELVSARDDSPIARTTLSIGEPGPRRLGARGRHPHRPGDPSPGLPARGATRGRLRARLPGHRAPGRRARVGVAVAAVRGGATALIVVDWIAAGRDLHVPVPAAPLQGVHRDRGPRARVRDRVRRRRTARPARWPR